MTLGKMTFGITTLVKIDLMSTLCMEGAMTIGKMTFSITTLGKMDFIATIGKNDTLHNDTR
jgi:hypothetical protein